MPTDNPTQSPQLEDDFSPGGQCVSRLPTLRDLAEPPPENENPNALFKDGWLRKGGAAFFIAPSGVGKSVWSMQATILWSMGKPAFGIVPVRPLKIVIVQSEDDNEEMYAFREDITEGLIRENLATRQEIEEACGNIGISNGVGRTNEAFAEMLKTLAHNYDLVIANPFQAYAGIDILRPDQLTTFLRKTLDPVIKQEGKKLGVIFIHHTNKPPSEKERKAWETGIYSAYSGAGGAELVNWSRAILTLFPVGEKRLFALSGCKKGDRLGWLDNHGSATNTRYIAHSDGIKFWREPSQDEIAQALSNKPSTDMAGNARRLAVDILSQGAMTLTEARGKAIALSGRYHGCKAFNVIKDNPADYGLALGARTRHGQLIGDPVAIEQAMREQSG